MLDFNRIDANRNNRAVNDVNRKEVMSFRKTVAAAATGVLRERIKADCTIEGVRVKFYQGQQLGLLIKPLIFEKKTQISHSLITYAENTDAYLAGDSDYFEYDIVRPASNDDYVEVFYNNTAAFNCTIVVDVIIDYFGGKRRVI